MSQLTDVFHNDGSGRAFDRFLCHWQGGGPGDEHHIRYGPPCISLTVALAWCAEHAERAFVDGFGNRRWSVGEPSDGFPPLPEELSPAPLSWNDHIAGTWEVDVSLNLGLTDYANAAPGFEPALRSGTYDVRTVTRDHLGARLRASLVVAAPTEHLAGVVATEEVRRAATDLCDGLHDEHGDCLGVELH